MLKSIAVTCLSTFICCFSYSQQIVIKPTVGLNFTNFSKSPNGDKFTAQLGYEGGASVSFGQKFYVEPGVFAVRKSTNYSTTSSDSSGFSGSNKGNFKLNGIRIPLAIGYNIIGGDHPTDPIGLRVFGGGSAFLLRTNDQTADFNKAQWGVFAGAGLDIAFLFLDAQYEWSLTNLQKDVSQVDIGKTRSIYINLGVRIPVGK